MSGEIVAIVFVVWTPIIFLIGVSVGRFIRDGGPVNGTDELRTAREALRGDRDAS